MRRSTALVASGTTAALGGDGTRQRGVLRRILAYVAPSWVLISLALVLTVITSGLSQVPQLANRYLINHVLSPNPKLPPPTLHYAFHLLLVVAGIILAMRILNSGIGFLRSYTMRIVGQRLIYSLRRDVYRKVHYLSADFYLRNGVGQIMSRVMNDTNTVQNFIAGNITTLASQIMTFFISFAIMSHYDMRLTIYLLLFGPPIAGSILFFSGILRELNRNLRKQTARLTAALHDSLAGFVTIKAFGVEEHVISRFEEENRNLFSLGLRRMRTQAIYSNSVALVTGSSWAFFILFGGMQVVHHQISLGTYFLINGLRGSIFIPFTSFANLNAAYQQAAAGAERIFEYLDTAATVRDTPTATRQPRVRGSIVFDGVVFRYPAVDLQAMAALHAPDPWSDGRLLKPGKAPRDRDDPGDTPPPPVVPELVVSTANDSQPDPSVQTPAEPPPPPPPALNGVSFTVEPGETVGIVGPSGSGKSTIAKLVMRLYDVEAGAVRIDGVDVRDFTLSSLREQMAVVLQDVFLFSASVRENVSFGMEGASNAEIDDALRAANASFVWDLPYGPDTVVGEGGATLSGGERQRVAIARALLRRPRILLLDEATSAQDPLSEESIMHSLRERAGDLTILIIAHRLSTITHADRILVMEDGAIVQQGRHEELLALGGPYARLYGAGQEPVAQRS